LTGNSYAADETTILIPTYKSC